MATAHFEPDAIEKILADLGDESAYVYGNLCLE